MSLGATMIEGGGAHFCLWAPKVKTASVKVYSGKGTTESRLLKDETGYFTAIVPDVLPGEDYCLILNEGVERPDPASRFQPRGVHGRSRIADIGHFLWNDEPWRGLSLSQYIIYELHVGTFTPEGTFAGVISALPYLKDLGITALELMPVAQFPGRRNWGYDGVYPFAPQNSYGGPAGLAVLVNECHKQGLAVILDVVYNHLGPEGNYLRDFGPYFTDRYKSFWGDAINFDGSQSDHVRRFFIDNALYWIGEYHIDALRLDAIHGIWDFGAKHFLQELKEAVSTRAESLGRKVYLIAESDLNDIRFITATEEGGCGLDAQWNDDFHHALHALITGEKKGYYADFGRIEDLEKAFREGYVYSGQFSKYRQRRHGNSSVGCKAEQFVVFSQNHDQIGNRPTGDRSAATQDMETLKLAAGTVLLSPYIPLLFMGEEYGEKAPFQYFIDHSDPGLLRAVREGRANEFASFEWGAEVPDPGAESTFQASKIDLDRRMEVWHKQLLDFYKHLIRQRKSLYPLRFCSKDGLKAGTYQEGLKVLWTDRCDGGRRIYSIYNYEENQVDVGRQCPPGKWSIILDSSAREWGGPGSRTGETVILPGSLKVNRRSFLLLAPFDGGSS